MISVRELSASDTQWKEEQLIDTWGDTQVARLGEVVDLTPLDGFLATYDGQRAGLLLHTRRGDELEVVSLHVTAEGRGIGRALMNASRALADSIGARRLWLVTTNDNVRAIRFYQMWGLDLAALHRNAVAVSRTLKPAIPLVGPTGIPLRHELELELIL